MQAKKEQQNIEIQTLKAQLADRLRRIESAVQSGALSSRGAAGLPPGDDLNRDQCGAAKSDRAAGNGSGSMSMIRSVSDINLIDRACKAAESEGHLAMA